MSPCCWSCSSHPPLPLWPLTKRDELSFRRVLALPKASMAGLASMIWSSRVPCRDERCSLTGTPEQPRSWVSAHSGQPLVGKGKWGGPQDLAIIVRPTYTGPILTPVFVARNCWGEKEDKVRGCEVWPGQGWQRLAGQWVLVAHVYSLPPQTPCLSLPGLLQGEMLESRSKHGPSQGPEAGGCVWGSPIHRPSPPQRCP